MAGVSGRGLLPVRGIGIKDVEALREGRCRAVEASAAVARGGQPLTLPGVHLVEQVFNRRRRGTERTLGCEAESRGRGGGLIIGERRDAGLEGDILHLLLSDDGNVVADEVGYVDLVGHRVHHHGVGSRPDGHRTGAIRGHDGNVAADDADVVGHVILVGHRVHRHGDRAGSDGHRRGAIRGPVDYRDFGADVVGRVNLVGHRVHRHRLALRRDRREHEEEYGQEEAKPRGIIPFMISR